MSTHDPIEVTLHEDGEALVISDGVQDVCTSQRAHAIAVALKLTRESGRSIVFALAARLPHEVIELRCPMCDRTDVETWADDGESDVADFAECLGCRFTSAAGMFEQRAVGHDERSGSIAARVLATLQEADEIGGLTHDVPAYCALMESIAAECTRRAKAARGES